MIPRDRCPCCGGFGAHAIDANIDAVRMSEATFASRKRPELMHHEYWECASCRTYFTPEIPNVDDLYTDYRDASFDSGVEAAYASRTYSEAIRARARLLCRGSALDIGTGDGAFLESLLDMGFQDVRGVEPSLAPIEAALPRVRPLIIQGLFEKGSFGPETLDLVTCFQTIEHVPDPSALVQEAFSILRPGGYLAIVCHDRKSPVNRLLGRKSPIFDIEHLQLLTRTGLRGLFTRAGFSDVDVSRIRNRYPARYWLRLAPLPTRIGNFLESQSDSRLLTQPVSVGVGNVICVGRKSDDKTPF
jgi:SAM-dependent methyltransferase